MKIVAHATYTTQEAVNLIASYLKELFNNTQQTVDHVNVIIEDPTPPQMFQAPVLDLNAPVPQLIIRLIVERNLIGAIKEYRAMTGLGLKEAKDYVEHVRDKVMRLP